MRKWIALLAAVGALSFAGCTNEVKDGAMGDVNDPGYSETEFHGPLGDEAGYDEYGQPKPVVINNLSQPYTYADGVMVQPTVTAGVVDQKVRAIESRYGDAPKAGRGWVNFKLRATNNSQEPFDGLQLIETQTYGADALEAEFGSDLQYKSKVEGFNTHILPTKSKTRAHTYLIPEEHWNEITVEITRHDGDWPTLIYTGAVS